MTVGGGATALQEQGRRLLTVFHAALRALKFYPVENATVQQALNELQATIDGLLESENAVKLRLVGDFFFLNETRLRVGITSFSTFAGFSRALGEHRIGGVIVQNGVRREEWAPFLSLLLRGGKIALEILQFYMAQKCFAPRIGLFKDTVIPGCYRSNTR